MPGSRQRPGFFRFLYNAQMPMTRRCLIATSCLGLLAGAVAFAPVEAADGGRGDERSMADTAITLDEAVARAERRHDARAVRAEEKRRDDRIVYRIRLLGADGRVFEVTVDAQSGQEI